VSASISWAPGFVTYLGLPMIVNDEVLGVLSFYSTEAIDLRAEEEIFLTDITQQAAIALHNSRLSQTKNQATSWRNRTDQRRIPGSHLTNWHTVSS
jgi:GAF domain-containing protein